MESFAPEVTAVAVFVGVLALAVALMAALTRGGAEIRRRLDVHVVRVSADDARRLERVNILRANLYSHIPWLDRALARVRPARTAVVELKRAGLLLPVGWYLTGRVLLGLVLAPALWLLLSPFAAPLGLVAGTMLPRLVLRLRARRRRKAFEAQLAEGIDLIVGAMRTGYGFLQGLEAVTKELANPMRGEFTRLLEQVNVGANPVDALSEMTERIDSYDLSLFASAIAVHRTAGGNLAEVLENIANTVRERRRIRAEVFSLTTGPRVSSYALCMIPIGLLIAFSIIDPGDYRRVMLHSGVGHAMMAFAATWSLIGLVVSQRLAKVEY